MGKIRVLSSSPCDVTRIVRKRRDPGEADAVIEDLTEPLPAIVVGYTEEGDGGIIYGRTAIIIGTRFYIVVRMCNDPEPRSITLIAEDEGAKRPVVEITVRPVSE